MSKSTSNVVAFAAPPVEKDALTELIRQGAQQLPEFFKLVVA